MGYDVHITRRPNWFDQDGDAITPDEWLACVASDPEMRLDGFAQAGLADGSVLRVDDPSMAVWIGHPQHGQRDGMAWLWLGRGCIDAKNPDEPTLGKMWRIAQALGAQVQGDDGEYYGEHGQPPEGPDAAVEAPPAPARRPWWRWWR